MINFFKWIFGIRKYTASAELLTAKQKHQEIAQRVSKLEQKYG